MLLPSVTEPVAHSPLVVLADLSRWPATGLERIKTNPVPTATRCSWQVRGRAAGSSFHTPSPAPSNSGAQKLWVSWCLGWVGRSCLGGQARPPRDRGMLGSPALPWLAESWDQAPTEGTHRCSPFLSCPRGLQQSSHCPPFNRSTRKKNKKKKRGKKGRSNWNNCP